VYFRVFSVRFARLGEEIEVLRRLTILIVLAAVAVPAVALAVAKPVTPSRGALVASTHPVFSWTLPANERSDALFIANRPKTNPEGRFPEANLVDASYFTRNGVLRYAPARQFYAGRYWWLVEASDVTTYQVSHSAPVDFRIPARTSFLGVKFTHRLPGRLSIDVRWTTNTRQLVVQGRVFLGKRRLFGGVERRALPPIGGVRHTLFAFATPKFVKPGTLVRLEVTVAGIGHAEAATRHFRAP
jgi:hypothetical protein